MQHRQRIKQVKYPLGVAEDFIIDQEVDDALNATCLEGLIAMKELAGRAGKDLPDVKRLRRLLKRRTE